MLYHIQISFPDTIRFHVNLGYEEILSQYVCPYVAKETTLLGSCLQNIGNWHCVHVFATDRPVDSEWPIKQEDFKDDKSTLEQLKYNIALYEALHSSNAEKTEQAYRDAIIRIQTGGYKSLRNEVLKDIARKEAFFICPFDNDEVNHNYDFVVKPAVRAHQFDIKRVDEICHTKELNRVILDAIAASPFVVADLTDSRPNCYYEVGYAHALGKPIIILAREGTRRDFDISMYKWNYWRNYQDLKPTLEAELAALVQRVKAQSH